LQRVARSSATPFCQSVASRSKRRSGTASLRLTSHCGSAGCRHAWEGYKKHAWGSDEIKPVTGKRCVLSQASLDP
jgi:hypothetical protein